MVQKILQIHNYNTTVTGKQKTISCHFEKKNNLGDITRDVSFDSFSSKMVHQHTQLILCKTGSRQTVQNSLTKISGL